VTEYDAPHRTETQILADHITRATSNLARDWPNMWPRGGNQQTPGWASRSGVILDDHDPSDADTTRATRILSLRRHTQDILNSWCRLIIEDRPVTAGIPLGTDVPGMCDFITRHADWMSGHADAEDCRDELTDLSHRCHLTATPRQRDSMSIGRCPLEQPDEDGHLSVCDGDVRVRLTGEDRDGEAYAACGRCGEVAVSSWWESRMFDDPELNRWLTDAGVVTLIHSTYGDTVAQSTIRKWVERDVLKPSTKSTEDGRRLFDRDAVIYAYERHKRRQQVGSA
jgi:hypothetical protein